MSNESFVNSNRLRSGVPCVQLKNVRLRIGMPFRAFGELLHHIVRHVIHNCIWNLQYILSNIKTTVGNVYQEVEEILEILLDHPEDIWIHHMNQE